jgi:hypothetical protein
LSELITEQREKQVHSQAKKHLQSDEEVIHWARATHPDHGRHGFLYLTTRRFLVVWAGRHDASGAVSWTDMHAWGVDAQARGGPLLGIESPGGPIFVHMPVRNVSGARRASSFLQDFARLAPRPRRRLHKPGHPAGFVSDPSMVVINRRKLSPAELTKRIVLTVLGLLLMFTGAVITPIPGPWSLPLLLGGLAVLASEYDWAKDLLEWVKAKSRNARERFRARRTQS